MSAVLRTERRPAVDIPDGHANGREEAGGQPAIAQLELVPAGRLPLDPWSLAATEPAILRGRHYAALDLDSWQIACAEEAIRMVRAGAYPAERVP